MILRYLNNKTQRIKINKTFSSWRELLYGVTHRSALTIILFNIYLHYLLLFLNRTDICNFDNNTIAFMCHKNLAELSEKLEKISELAIHWFEDNYTNLNTGKCHLLISGHKYECQ